MAYKTISESFWTDPKVRNLTPIDKLLFLYLISNPHSHYSGLYYLPPTFISEEIGVSVKAVLEGLGNLESINILRYDKVNSVVWIINMCGYQMSQGGNPASLRSGIQKHIDTIHSFELIKLFIEYNQALTLTLKERSNNVKEWLKQPSVTDTDTDTDTEINKKGNSALYKEIISDLNEKTGKHFKITDDAKKLINARMKEGFLKEHFLKVHSNQSLKWKDDVKMNQYLRPATLYSQSKFQGYLNSETPKKWNEE